MVAERATRNYQEMLDARQAFVERKYQSRACSDHSHHVPYPLIVKNHDMCHWFLWKITIRGSVQQAGF
jgi:hypothetical protein